MSGGLALPLKASFKRFYSPTCMTLPWNLHPDKTSFILTSQLYEAVCIVTALSSQFHIADTFIMSVGIYKCFLQTLTPKERSANAIYIISLTLRFYCIFNGVGRGADTANVEWNFFPSLKMAVSYSKTNSLKTGRRNSDRVKNFALFLLSHCRKIIPYRIFW